MTLKKIAPFERQYLEEERVKADIFTVRLNENERLGLNQAKKILEQPKDSTAFKQLAQLGLIVLQDNLTGLIITTLFKNKAKNARNNIIDFE